MDLGEHAFDPGPSDVLWLWMRAVPRCWAAQNSSAAIHYTDFPSLVRRLLGPQIYR